MDVVDGWGPSSASEHDVAVEILRQGPSSRAAIARRLGLSQASLTRLTKPLLARGLLEEVAVRTDRATGRPGRPLDVVASLHHFVGIKLAADRATAALVDLRGTVLGTADTAVDSHAVDDVVATLAALVTRAAGGTPVTGVGVGLGGSAADHRTVAVAPFLGWTDVPLADRLERATGVPTVVDNDVAALTAAEHWFGEGRTCRSLAVVTLGAGVGYGLVQHDRLVRHPDHGLGLVGHFPVSPDGAVCREGHRGCASAALTTSSLTGQASVALGRPVRLDELLALAAAGDPACARLVAEAARALGRLLAAVGNLTMPDRVVVTGEGVALAEVARAAVDAAIAADRDPRATPLDVVTRPGDFTQWARGAGVVAIQRFVLPTR